MNGRIGPKVHLCPRGQSVADPLDCVAARIITLNKYPLLWCPSHSMVSDPAGPTRHPITGEIDEHQVLRVPPHLRSLLVVD